MVSKFDKLLKELRAMSHEERMEIVKALVEGWKEWKSKQYERRR